LYCDAFDSTYVEWTESGASPYLNNSTANYITTYTVNYQEGDFGFADSAITDFSTITLTSIKICVENQTQTDAVGATVYYWDGTDWSHSFSIGFNDDTSFYFTKSSDIKAVINTLAKLNGLKIRFKKSGATYTVVARIAYIEVIYTVAGPTTVSRTVTEIIGSKDNTPSRLKDLYRNYPDLAGILDSLLQAKARGISKEEIIGILDSYSQSKTRPASYTELVGILDNYVQSKSRPITETELLGIIDSTVRILYLFNNYSDIIGILDTLTHVISTIGSITYTETLEEILGLLDSLSKQIMMARSKEDVMGILDSFSNKLMLFRVKEDLLGILDEITTQITTGGYTPVSEEEPRSRKHKRRKKIVKDYDIRGNVLSKFEVSYPLTAHPSYSINEHFGTSGHVNFKITESYDTSGTISKSIISILMLMLMEEDNYD
jgi:hypothetical protein